MQCAVCGVATLDDGRLCPICLALDRRLPFVGRAMELAVVEGAARTALATGRGQVVIVRGEAGIGKSRLADEAAARAAGLGLKVRHGAGVEAAIAAVLAASPGLAHFEDASGQVAVNDLLALPQPAGLAALDEAMRCPARLSARGRAARAILARAARERPLLLIIEDLHAAGPRCQDLFAAAAPAAGEGPVVVLATARTDGTPDWRDRLEGVPLTAIELHPLTAADALTLAGAALGTTDGRAAAAAERAGGNPLLLELLLRAVAAGAAREPLPSSVRAIVQLLLGRLGPADRHLLQAAAVLGVRFRLDALRQVAGDPEADPAALLDADFLRPVGTALAFTHAPLRDAVQSLTPRSRRRDLHRRAAAWSQGRDPAARARHLDAADDPAAAAAHASAAREAWRHHRDDAAARLAERGLELAESRQDRFDLTLVKAETLRRQGDARRAVEAFRAAQPLAGSDDERCAAWLGLAEAMHAAGHRREALAGLAEAEALALAAGLAAALARIHNRRGEVLFTRGETGASRAEHEAALGLARQTGSGGEVATALAGLGDCSFADGRYASAHSRFRGAIEAAEAKALGRLAVAVGPKEAFCRYYLLDLEGARTAAEASVLLAEQAGDHDAAILGHTLAVDVHGELCTPGRAAAHAGSAIALAQAAGAPRLEAVALAGLARSMLAGDRAGAAAVLERAMALGRRSGPHITCGRILGAMALAVAGEPDRLGRILAEAAEVLPAGHADDALAFHGAAIDALLAAGDWRRVEDHADSLVRLTAAEPVPWAEFRAARGRALAAHAGGRRDGALLATLSHLAEEARAAGMLASGAALAAAASGRPVTA
jgi:tetratricopeptide (TPR) repeat protein